jgi:hypothetical protein
LGYDCGSSKGLACADVSRAQSHELHCKERSWVYTQRSKQREPARALQDSHAFFHGEDDAFVPVAMLDEVYAAAECEKRRLKVPGASHALSAQVAPELYWVEVGEFLSARDM